MSLAAARQVADAVLYEGYLLYPYRASSSKNQVRWQFGVLGPPGASAAGVGEEPAMSTEILVARHAAATLDLYLRFLQVQSRVLERWTGAAWAGVDELLVAGTRWISFHEAAAREVPLVGIGLDELGAGRAFGVGAPAGIEVEALHEGGGLVGRLVRTRWEVSATVTLSTRPARDPRLVILQVRVDNHTGAAVEDTGLPGSADAGTARDVAARYSLVGTHLLLSSHGTEFVSLLDGPAWSAADAASCAQSRCWPVLVADDDGRDAVLVSPIILGDHPSIAPESAGDLFDATEIDEILTLRVMTMTEQEKADARGTDPRAAAILSRCDAMDGDALSLLHGARRSPDVPIPEADPLAGEDVPWWDAGQEARAEPTTDAVMVRGVPVSQGTRVLLRPSRRADAQDLFLAGLTAIVARVYFDVDGGTHVAVALEDDPGSDLYGATGRFYYFGPEEIEPLAQRVPGSSSHD